MRFCRGSAPGWAGFLSCVSAQVRSLWAAVDGLVCSVGAQQEGVDRVLQGQVDQHVLDGTGRALKVPRRLQERVEQLPQVRVTPASSHPPRSLSCLLTSDL